MTQIDYLSFCLLAAGAAEDLEGKGTYLLYVDPETSSLVSKLWNGVDVEKIGHAETIAESVRANSRASYILTPSIRLIAYISSNNQLRVCELDDESDEWVDDSTLPQCKVHPQGQITAALFPSDRVRIIFQDPSKRLNTLEKVNGSWKSTAIPVEPAAGSAIGTWANGKQLHIFYVSANTNSLHYAVEEAGGTWRDVAVANCAFNDKSKPKRLAVLSDPSTGENWQLFVMSEANTLWQFTPPMEKVTKLGNMNGNKFVPDSSEERCILINLRHTDCGFGPSRNTRDRFYF